MAEFRRTEILSGLFIVLAVVIFTFLVIQSGTGFFDSIFGAGPQRQYVALVPQAHNLKPDDPVRWRGLPIGRVLKVEPVLPGSQMRSRFSAGPPRVEGVAEDAQERFWVKPGETGVLVTFSLRAKALDDIPDLDIDSVVFDPTRSYVHVQQDGLIGNWFLTFVDVQPDANARREKMMIASSDAPPLAIWGRSDGIFDVIPAIAEQVSELTEELQAQLGSLEENAIGGMISSATSAARSIEGAGKEAQALAARFNEMFAKSDPNSLDKQLMSKLDQAIKILNDRTGDLQVRSLKFLDGVDEKLAQVLTELQLERRSKELGEVLSNTSMLVAGLRHDTLTAVARLSQAAWQLNVAAAKIRANPNVIIFGDDEEIVEPAPAEASGLRRTGRFGPFGQRSEDDDQRR